MRKDEKVLILFFSLILWANNLCAQGFERFFQRYVRSQDALKYLSDKYQPAPKLSVDTLLLFGSNRMEFADYLFCSKQYKLAAIEYRDIFCRQPSLDILLKLEKSLIHDCDYLAAEQVCDSLSRYTYIKSYNIRSCLYLMQGKYDAFDTLDKQLLLPSIIVFRQVPVTRKSPFAAASLSAALPGLGQIYSGNAPQGVVSIIIAALDAVHIAYGVRKYGIRNFYPLVSIGLGAGFYVGNIIRSAKSARYYNHQVRSLRNAKLTDYMSDVLF